MATFYPRFFWLTRGITISFIFLNECRKSGIIYALKLAANDMKWRLNLIQAIVKNRKDTPVLSLRKVLRNNHLPDIVSDNPVMEKLRQGR